MKAAVHIDFPNLRAFENRVQKEGMSSSFSAKVGDNIEEVMKKNGYSQEEIDRTKIRIIKGNHHWVVQENEKEKEEFKSVRFEKEMEDKEKETLGKLNKKQQLDLLKELGAKTFPASEGERIDLIMKLRILN